MEFGNPPVIEFTRALGCVGEAARENAVTVAGGVPFQTKPNQTQIIKTHPRSQDGSQQDPICLAVHRPSDRCLCAASGVAAGWGRN